jgi:hypothetical protein
MYGNMRQSVLVARRFSMISAQVPEVSSVALLATGDWKRKEDMALCWIMRGGNWLMEWRQLIVSATLFARLRKCMLVATLVRKQYQDTVPTTSPWRRVDSSTGGPAESLGGAEMDM